MTPDYQLHVSGTPCRLGGARNRTGNQALALVHAPYGIALTPDGHTTFVTGGEAGTPIPPDVTEIDLSSGKVSGTFSIPGGANGIVNATSS
jgi:hypothetical protein